MNKRILIGIIVVAVIAVGNITYHGSSQKHTRPVEKVKLGVETSILPSTVWVAENKGYFKEEGLEVEIKEFASGKTALATMLSEGNLDIVTVAETPVVFNSFDRNDYTISAAMVYSDNDVKILIRKGKGIQNPSDLKGKKIGITLGSTGHYFIGLFLDHSGLLYSDVETTDFEASDLPQALADGRVDAIITWEPHIFNAKKLLGNNAILLPSKAIFREEFYFVSLKDFINKNPDTIKRFLKAIERGETFIQENRSEAIDLVSERLKIDKEFITGVWDDFVFAVSLDQSLLITLEDQAKWAIVNNLVDATEVPNYLDYIYLDALDEVKPEAIGIID